LFVTGCYSIFIECSIKTQSKVARS